MYLIITFAPYSFNLYAVSVLYMTEPSRFYMANVPGRVFGGATFFVATALQVLYDHVRLYVNYPVQQRQ